MRDQDRQFFDFFMLIVGILMGLAVGVFFLVRMVAIETQGEFVLDDPTVQAEILARIEPVGHVLLMGDEELAAATAAVMAPARVEAALSGPQVYNEACYLCHAAPGVGGAPVLGEPSAWTDRIAQGMEILADHAINGYQGSAGFMPAKGGRVDLSDAEVRLAVEYMVDESSPAAE